MTAKTAEPVKEREGVMQTEGTVNAKAQNGPFWNKNWVGRGVGGRIIHTQGLASPEQA